MLSKADVFRLYDAGLDIKVSYRRPDNLWGLYDPSDTLATIFINNISKFKDIEETVLHEMIHARDDLFRDGACKESWEEERVNREARQTRANNRERIMRPIYDLYYIELKPIIIKYIIKRKK